MGLHVKMNSGQCNVKVIIKSRTLTYWTWVRNWDITARNWSQLTPRTNRNSHVESISVTADTLWNYYMVHCALNEQLNHEKSSPCFVCSLEGWRNTLHIRKNCEQNNGERKEGFKRSWPWSEKIGILELIYL